MFPTDIVQVISPLLDEISFIPKTTDIVVMLENEVDLENECEIKVNASANYSQVRRLCSLGYVIGK